MRAKQVLLFVSLFFGLVWSLALPLPLNSPSSGHSTSKALDRIVSDGRNDGNVGLFPRRRQRHQQARVEKPGPNPEKVRSKPERQRGRPGPTQVQFSDVALKELKAIAKHDKGKLEEMKKWHVEAARHHVNTVNRDLRKHQRVATVTVMNTIHNVNSKDSRPHISVALNSRTGKTIPGSVNGEHVPHHHFPFKHNEVPQVYKDAGVVVHHK
jgi:hypothetical protein